ncbi:hypothetical protein CEY16_06540 [Halalkalibacillus sediminis]|uniref:Uncharacterized protein n=1 Tax=Halalkalibacillus sediminis TaxID=2018042 RepID=A0A2I0QTC3_9BACI|nr:YeeE/YedE family protein [Halalkalibacillus sediminis]PKR77592.1 hypothetical protein CEY16_06540 [Halalkalibacillus sediminis]
MSENEKRYRKPQNIITAIFFIISIIIAYQAYIYSGWQFVLLFIIGFFIGFTLFHARYGFATVYRHLVEDHITEMLRGHMIKFVVVTILFTLIFQFNIGLSGNLPDGAISPVTTGVVIGAFIFGFGMEFGSGLAPGRMNTAKGGRTALLFTASGFLIGATVGAVHFSFWNTSLPNGPQISLAKDTPLGFQGALLLQLIIFTLIGVGSYIYKRRTRPPALPPMPKGAGWTKFLFGTWPIWVGAVLIASLNAAVLVVQGSPWKLTAAFTTWGSKIAQHIGLNPSSWSYWGEEAPVKTLNQSVFLNNLSVLNFGVISGALITMSLAGLIRFSKIPPKLMITSLAGGFLMGYGACISFGANVGAYFSGIASFSLHAWIWALMAISGVFIAFYLEKKLQITR